MINIWLLPWVSEHMIKKPIAMPVFMVLLSVFLSVITWIRQRDRK